MTTPRIHGLDSLRIMAEYVVVQWHLIGMANRGGPPQINATYNMLVTADLMSFFFVLSGYVCMLQHGQQDVQWYPFWKKKMSRVAPIYYICVVWTILKGVVPGGRPRCPFEAVCFVGHFFLLSFWLNCSNYWIEASWYLQILVGFWFLFPFMRNSLQNWFKTYPWPKIGLFYLLSVLFTALVPVNVSKFAPLHLVNFVIGCGATSCSRLSPVILAPVTVCVAAVYLVNFYYGDMFCMSLSETMCNPLSGHDYSQVHKGCDTFLLALETKMSFVWALVIHIVASNNLLEYNLFKVFNSFSLFLYMFHINVGHVLIEIAHACKIKWDTCYLTPVVYYICFLISVGYSRVEARVADYFTKKSPDTLAECVEVQNI